MFEDFSQIEARDIAHTLGLGDYEAESLYDALHDDEEETEQ